METLCPRATLKPEPREPQATIEAVLPGEAAVAAAARRSLEGNARGFGRIWPFLGPAFVAAVAYIDPGNFATNISGGAKFGYLLLWVVLAANASWIVVPMIVFWRMARKEHPFTEEMLMPKE